MRRLAFLWLLALWGGCAPNTDLTVAPPPQARASYEAVAPAARDDGRLPDDARPERYQLSFEIDPRAQRFSGDVLIDVTLMRPTGAIVLHGAELEVLEVEVVSAGVKTAARAQLREAAGARDEREELVVFTEAEIPAGEAQLHIRYQAPLSESLRGMYRVADEDGAFVFTQLEPSDARRMFPCFDDPAFKVPFDISVTVPAGNQVLSNTPERGRRASADGKKVTVDFATSKPLPTYLVALAIGPLEIRSGSTAPVPIRLVSTKGKSAMGGAALKVAADMLELLADYFGTPYPYAKLDLVAAPNFGPGGMENAGLVVFREELLLLDEKTAGAKARRDLAMLMAHELAHMWFGNLVTMQWWDDLWLNEGLASYVETLVVERYEPEMRPALEALTYTGWVMGLDALSVARTVRQPVSNTYEAEEAFDGITYIKGAAVIGMLHGWLGEAPFRAGLRTYLRDNSWGNATADELFSALAGASGKDVRQVARAFVDQPGVPLVRVSTVCERGAPPRVQLSQQRYRPRPAPARVDDDPLWAIPVCVQAGRGQRGQGEERVCTLLSERSTTLELPAGRCPTWVLPNAGYAGYYRYAMPLADLDALATAARAAGGMELIGYLSNMWALVQAGDVPADKMLELLASVGDTRDPAVVTELVAELTRVSDALVEDEARAAFQALVARSLLPIAKRLGWASRPSESEDDGLMRRTVLSALAVLTEDPWIRAEGGARAKAFLADFAAVEVDLAAVALMVAARSGQIGFDELRAALERVESPRRRTAIVQGLASFRDQGALAKTLALLANGGIRAQDSVYVARAASEWPDSRATLIGWLEQNLASIAKRYPGFGTARMVSTVRRLCDAGSRGAAERALTPVLEGLGSSRRRLSEALETAELCIDLRSRQAAAVTKYLKRRGAP